jgi:hypothetical protein
MYMEGEGRWLLLIHQIPPQPTYFRVKIWRRLQQLGAIPVKNSVYVLPATDQSLEDFQWMAQEIRAGGGDATLCEARLVEGLSDAKLIAMFRDARNRDYEALAKDIASAGKTKSPEGRALLLRLKKSLAEVKATDYFGASKGKSVEAALSTLESRLKPRDSAASALRGSKARNGKNQFAARTWVTRTGIHVDRIASAWLIRRFIDPEARFKFVPPKGYAPLNGEIRFDMFEAEYTHEGDRCTFEVLVSRMLLKDRELRAIGEIVHDIDLKDSRFGRPETPGIAMLIAGLAMAHKSDEERLQRGMAVFDDLRTYFKTKAKS